MSTKVPQSDALETRYARLRRVLQHGVLPHQGLEQQIPVAKASGQGHGPASCRAVLGGIIHDYCRDVS